MRRFVACIALVLAASGCSLVADFDRSLIDGGSRRDGATDGSDDADDGSVDATSDDAQTDASDDAAAD